MWTLHRKKAGLLMILALLNAPYVQGGEPINNYNQNFTNYYGMNLPQIPVPNGQDEIRAADGTTCKSTVASSGSYFDTGVIGSNDTSRFNAGGVYARVVVPLEKAPKRLDCTTLYQLEIERLRMELEVAKLGVKASAKLRPSMTESREFTEGWKTQTVTSAPPSPKN